jgi:hypothetical protein
MEELLQFSTGTLLVYIYTVFEEKKHVITFTSYEFIYDRFSCYV